VPIPTLFPCSPGDEEPIDLSGVLDGESADLMTMVHPSGEAMALSEERGGQVANGVVAVLSLGEGRQFS